MMEICRESRKSRERLMREKEKKMQGDVEVRKVIVGLIEEERIKCKIVGDNSR